MHRNLVRNLEDSILRASIISRYILISYINAREVGSDDIFYYVGAEGSRIIYGKAQLSVTQVSRQQLRALIREKFAKEQKGAVVTALQCLDRDRISSWIIKLRDECIEAFKLCNVCRDLEAYIDALNDAFTKGRTSFKLSDVEALLPTKTYSGYSPREILLLLTALFPAVFKLLHGGIDIHEYVITNFDQLRDLAKAQKGNQKVKPLLLKLFDVALSKLDTATSVEFANFVIYSAPIKYKMPLSVFYQALEIAYWKYIAELYKRKGGTAPMVALQDLVPYIEPELKRYGYLVPSLSEAFKLATEIEKHEIQEYGRSAVHVAIPVYLGPDTPIPIRFYRPKHLTVRELVESFGIPLDELRRFWDVSER